MLDIANAREPILWAIYREAGGMVIGEACVTPMLESNQPSAHSASKALDVIVCGFQKLSNRIRGDT